eukprot:CAMPEP_0206193470 /NCGR_PEP_ID=MMETSP0166-20121206/6582_1 /ASSEMBLY_ACC=CAM_ASM_000260 /TAXON_ID=95228 /ORGANISM="Vannella robusta, Strain DIVA3 518/3/11/1/6" /LENGTH=236 /DNA_ID=CAMNT_0053610181 /DNA_START=411 /DNA_END=1119 /DNA_ORIENTATION=+
MCDSDIELLSDMEVCEKVLGHIMSHRYAFPFLKPVDYVALNIPDYPNIITNPMDLSSVKKKLESFEYVEAQQFIADMDLIFQNAKTYNPPNSDVHTMAQILQKLFHEKIRPISMPHARVDTKLYNNLLDTVKKLQQELKELRNSKEKEKTKEENTAYKAEKCKLSADIHKLPGPELAVVVKIIQEKNADLLNDEEIEIDIGALDCETQRTLQQYVREYNEDAERDEVKKKRKRRKP